LDIPIERLLRELAPRALGIGRPFQETSLAAAILQAANTPESTAIKTAPPEDHALVLHLSATEGSP
jgi:hypothetical protein